MNEPGNAGTVALFGICLAVIGFLLVDQWMPTSGLIANVMYAKVAVLDTKIPFGFVLLVGAALLAWAAYLKFVRGQRSNSPH